MKQNASVLVVDLVRKVDYVAVIIMMKKLSATVFHVCLMNLKFNLILFVYY